MFTSSNPLNELFVSLWAMERLESKGQLMLFVATVICVTMGQVTRLHHSGYQDLSSFQYGQVFKVHIYDKESGEEQAAEERNSRKNIKRASHISMHHPRTKSQEHEHGRRVKTTYIAISEWDTNHHC